MWSNKRDEGIYVLEQDNSAFIYVLKNKSLRDLYDLWHACLGQVNYYVISFFLRRNCLFHHYVVPVSLRKVIDCLILAMNMVVSCVRSY